MIEYCFYYVSHKKRSGVFGSGSSNYEKKYYQLQVEVCSKVSSCICLYISCQIKR